MEADVLAAFLAGVAAVVSSGLSLWLLRRRYQRDCDRRIEELRTSFYRGIEEGEKHK